MRAEGKKVFSFWQNWVTIKFTTLRRRKISGEQEGDEEMSAPSGKKTARPPQKRKKKAAVRPRSRITVILLAALLVGISVQIYRMFGQLQDASAQEKAYAQQLAELQETNRQLQEDLDNAGSLDLIEDIARDQLGMVREGEKIFRYSK